MAKVIQLVHESVHQNPLSNLMSTHDLRSTQGVSLTNFDSILIMLQGTYDKIMLYEIIKWFIINTFHIVSDKRRIIHSGDKPYFPKEVQQHFLKNGLTKILSMGVIWRNFHTVHSVNCGKQVICCHKFFRQTNLKYSSF